MVRIRIIYSKYGKYGYLIQDKYNSQRGRSIETRLKKLTLEEIEAFESGKLTALDLLKSIENSGEIN